MAQSPPPNTVRSKHVLTFALATCGGMWVAVMSCGGGGGTKTGAGGRGGAVAAATGGRAAGGAGVGGTAAGGAGAGGKGGFAGAANGTGGAAGAAGGTMGAAGTPGTAGAAGIGNSGGMAGLSGSVGGAGGGVTVSCAGGFIGTTGSLLSNGGFECPVVASGGFASYSPGQQFFGWTVVGASGQVSPLSGKYVSGAYSWPAHGGAQAIDLTGNGTNAATGISQVVPTVPGTAYRLSFWIGNLVAPAAGWGSSSTVNVSVDGVQVMSAVSADGAGATALAWKPFTLTFTAAATMTTVSFVNGDPSNDNSNILDDVVLAPAGAGGTGGGGGVGGAGGSGACGTLNGACCGDARTCDPGLTCQGGARCTACGRKGDLCCPVAGGPATGCNAGFKCVDFLGDDLPRCADCTNAARLICSTAQTCMDDAVQGPQCVP